MASLARFADSMVNAVQRYEGLRVARSREDAAGLARRNHGVTRRVQDKKRNAGPPTADAGPSAFTMISAEMVPCPAERLNEMKGAGCPKVVLTVQLPDAEETRKPDSV